MITFICVVLGFLDGLQPPEIKFIESHQQLKLEVTNPNDKPMRYSGYTSESFTGGIPEGTIQPLYRQQILKSGNWSEPQLGFCGTGIGEINITAKAKVMFLAVIPEGEWDAVKVGLIWMNGKQAQATYSQTITRAQVIPK